MSNDDTSDIRDTVHPLPDALQSRRQSLKTIGKFAAVTAPAMLVLLDARASDACPTSGNKTGWTVNGKTSVV